jgi:protein kinase A
VWKVKHKKEDKDYAMKEMSKAMIIAKKSVTSINFERDILCRLRHPYDFVKVDLFVTSDGLFKTRRIYI